MKIGFNKPYPAGNEMYFIADALKREHISGNGFYTKACHSFFESRYHFKKVLLTTSCTDALEMSAILMDIKPGDEVIMPSYTFPSCPNAFILRGAKVVFADCMPDHPNMDVKSIRSLITKRTRAILVVHYGGIACDMEKVMELANEFNLFVIEDAAQAINSYYKGKPLGGIGHFGCFSFHESKNITCGEGGMLVINDERFVKRAEVIWDKGTNRAAFFRGEVGKYSWIDIGSSFLLSELNAAFLYAQLQCLDEIQERRLNAWNYYFNGLAELEWFDLPNIPAYARNNAHCFYVVCNNEEEKIALENCLKTSGIQAVGHYVPLHMSDYFRDKHDGRHLPNTSRFAECLLRLPLFFELTPLEQQVIIKSIRTFAEQQNRLNLSSPSKPIIPIRIQHQSQ